MAFRAEAAGSRCENIFRITNLKSPVLHETADSFWLRSAEIGTASSYSDSIVEELGKTPSEEPMYRQLVAPALWHYARQSVAAPSSDRVTQMINSITADIARETARQRPRGNDRVRPQAMTADERREAMEVGHYGLIEGSRLPNSRTEAMKRQEAIHALILQAQRGALDGKRKDPAADVVTLEYDRIKQERRNEPSIPKNEIDALLRSPVDFAIVYAQLTGLMGRAGRDGEELSRFVPWGRPAADAVKFRTLSDMVAMSRAVNASLVDQRAADTLVLETLRQTFAPHLARPF